MSDNFGLTTEELIKRNFSGWVNSRELRMLQKEIKTLREKINSSVVLPDVIPVDSDLSCDGCKRLKGSKLNYQLATECRSCKRSTHLKDYYLKNQ